MSYIQIPRVGKKVRHGVRADWPCGTDDPRPPDPFGCPPVRAIPPLEGGGTHGGGDGSGVVFMPTGHPRADEKFQLP